MGILVLILLCVIELTACILALNPINEKYEIKSFRTFDDFFITKDEKREKQRVN
jgi:hypothetical protein